MIRRAILAVFTAICASVSLNATVEQADSAYTADDFLTAARLYQESIDELGPSTGRYYNLGNAYYRAGATGMAIVSYERALRIDPSNSDAADNLEFVKNRITDRIDSDSSLVSGAANRLALKAHPNTWAWWGIGLFILALAGVCLYFMADAVMLRKTGFFGGGIALLFCIFANIMAWRSANIATDTHRAVVISPSVILSTTPRQPKDRTEEAMLLHEGTEMTIIDSIKGDEKVPVWYDVKVSGKNRAWIPGNAIEII